MPHPNTADYDDILAALDAKADAGDLLAKYIAARIREQEKWIRTFSRMYEKYTTLNNKGKQK